MKFTCEYGTQNGEYKYDTFWSFESISLKFRSTTQRATWEDRHQKKKQHKM